MQVELDEALLNKLEGRLQRGESSSLSALIEADLMHAELVCESEEEVSAEVRAAYEEMESGEDPGIPIEAIMARYGIKVPGTTQST